MTKVEHTRKHFITFIVHNASNPERFDDVLVADAELVLIQCKPEDVKSAKRCTLLRKDAKTLDVYDHNIHFDPEITPNARFFKPILISRTEKIEVGDWAYDAREHKIIKSMFNLEPYEDFEVMKYFHKILAIPKHLSPSQLQDIVDGKLKESKVVVECEHIEVLPNHRKENQHWEMVGLARQDNDMKDAEKHTKLARLYQTGESYSRIKLNSSNHVTIYPVEEKMYTREEIRTILHKFNNAQSNEDIFRLNTWFEQNVK